eukprot:COSAG02_NODE_603_length_19693_cov_3.883944_7_plen_95_part_00
MSCGYPAQAVAEYCSWPGGTHCEIKVLDVTDLAASLFGDEVQEGWRVTLVHLVLVDLLCCENLHVDAKYRCESTGISRSVLSSELQEDEEDNQQ